MATKASSSSKLPKARKVKEIIVELKDTRGALAKILEMLAEKKVNLLAYSALHMGSVGVLHLLPDSTAKASRILEKADVIKISTSDIVFVEAADKVGAGAMLARKIADAGINIHYSYATAAGARKFGVAYQTNDNAKAVRTLNI